jgi:glycosyltransferase involved in cell wall biosynthesis
MPQISVITPTYNTPKHVLARTWASLKAQTFTDWEWIVYDDSTDPGVARQLYGYQSDERHKLTVWSGLLHSGIIGQVKRVGFMSATGDILVELDHDDELTPDALAEIAAAFENPQIGFAFSDWCEILPDGQSGVYPDGWGLGYGYKYWTGDVWALSIPLINEESLSHIVAVPNHVRAWRASTYRELGGHNQDLSIADDYELIIRTALYTRWHHIPKMLYRQHIGKHTAQRQRNAEIQTKVAEIHAQYKTHIAAKFGAQ